MSETDAPGAGDGYIDSYVAFMDILGFSALTDRADSDPGWRKFLTDTIRLLRTRLPTQIEQNRFRATQFSDCIVISVQRADQGLFTMLSAAALLASNLFDRGLIMRGGIARGNFHHDDQIMFGPALIRAHAFDQSGTPPHVALHDDVVADISQSEYATVLDHWVRPDPWDLSPMLHTLHRFESYPQAGDLVIPDDAQRYADHISTQASNMDQKPAIRAKWRWMQDYWNRTVAVKGVLKRST